MVSLVHSVVLFLSGAAGAGRSERLNQLEMRAKGLNGDPLYFIQRDLFLAAVVEHGGAREGVVGDVLRRFQGALFLR